MNIIVVGGGSVGKSIARDLIKNTSHGVTIIDFETEDMQTTKVTGAKWVTGDSCDPEVLESAGIRDADVLVTATGNDQSNLVTSMLAKTEFGIGKVIARINHPKNAHMYDSSWGVDLSVSMPEAMTALIEEVVSEDVPVPIFKIQGSKSALLKYRISRNSEYAGLTQSEFLVECPGLILCAVVRGTTVYSLDDEITIEAGDEIVLLSKQEQNERT